MSDENRTGAVTAVAACLRESLAEEFQALYLLDSPAGPAAAELAIVVAETFWDPEPAERASFHRLRRAFAPVWQQAGHYFRQAPLLATPANLAHYSLLHPVFARRLTQEARLVAGAEARPPLAEVDRASEAAYWACQSLRLSAVLAPALMEPVAATQRLAELGWAVSQWRQQPVADDETPARLLAELQQHVTSLLPAPDASTQKEFLEGAPPLLPQLRAIYERGGTVILLLPHLTAADLAAVDWPKVATLFQGDYTELQVTTPTQFRLSRQFQEPMAYALGFYRCLWGEDALAGLDVERWRILRDAARLPAQLLIGDLPQGYLSGLDAHTLIHDCHNRLLNVQLQHELLARSLQLAAVTAPAQLRDQKAPAWQRIDAIVAALWWWTDYYGREMVNGAS
jgi:hypothetical protein